MNEPTVFYYVNNGNKGNQLGLKVSNCLAYTRLLNQRFDLIAEALFSAQKKYYELVPHVSLKYNFNREENKAVLFGACFRTRDAGIVRLGYTNKTFHSGISYDINLSRFLAATGRQGAFEIFVNYIVRSKPAFKPKRRVCPVFM